MNEQQAVVIDTNVILRHLLNDHDEHSPRASALFLKVRLGERSVFCPDTVIFEAVHILHSRAGAPRDKAAAVLHMLLDPPSFVMDRKPAINAALTFWTEHGSLDYADCYHLALTRKLGMSRIYTFDKKMDRYPGAERIEP